MITILGYFDVFCGSVTPSFFARVEESPSLTLHAKCERRSSLTLFKIQTAMNWELIHTGGVVYDRASFDVSTHMSFALCSDNSFCSQGRDHGHDHHDSISHQHYSSTHGYQTMCPQQFVIDIKQFLCPSSTICHGY